MGKDAQLIIDVVSDVVCPWCFLGKKRLEKALAEEGGDVAVRWRPFQLDPTIPAAGLDRAAYMRKKFGDGGRLQSVHDNLTRLGAEVGIHFAFDAIKRAPNTIDAHRLVRWAEAAGAQDAVVSRLFSLYFEQGGDIGDRASLLDVAEACGLDRATIAARFERGDDIEAVEAEIAEAQSVGVTGVPFFIFASRYAVPGAQDVAVLRQAIAEARQAPQGAGTG